MTQLNRLQVPVLHGIDSVHYTPAQAVGLVPGLPVYLISEGSQDVLRLELVFRAGTAWHANPLIPSFAASMMQEGSSKHSAAEIAEGIDRYGAFLELDHDKDFATITLYTLRRYFAETLEWVMEMVGDAQFPEREWEILRKNRLQKFRINSGKVAFVSGKKFQELIFGGSPYGAEFSEREYESATLEQLRQFRNARYDLRHALILLCGKVDHEAVEILRAAVKPYVSEGKGFVGLPQTSFGQAIAPGKHYIEKPDAIQSALRIGRRLFTRHHADYFGIKILSTVLGGYFGSRLMSNIREDKGYTYGIGAGAVAYETEGWFYISTEVGADVTRDALREIYFELGKLREEPIPADELDLVRNYMLGSLLKSFDGTFERMERFKGNMLYGLPDDYYARYTEAIRTISPAELQRIAQTWWREEDLTELVVGKAD